MTANQTGATMPATQDDRMVRRTEVQLQAIVSCKSTLPRWVALRQAALIELDRRQRS